MNLLEQFGKKIKNRRLELKLTQEELAHKTGYTSRSSINKIEMGLNDIPQSKIEIFAKALNTTSSYLLGWDETIAEAEKLPDIHSNEKINQLFAEYNITPERMNMLSGESKHLIMMMIKNIIENQENKKTD